MMENCNCGNYLHACAKGKCKADQDTITTLEARVAELESAFQVLDIETDDQGRHFVVLSHEEAYSLRALLPKEAEE